MKSVGLWLVKLLIFILLFIAGYMVHKVTDKNEYNFYSPTVPKLPKKAPGMFREYQERGGFYDLNAADFRRGERLYDFYNAWENKEPDGLYEIGWGIDDLVHMYWLTKEGKVYRFCISDHGTFRIAKTYWVDEYDDVFIHCFGEINEGHERHDPNTIKDCFLLLRGEYKKENRRFIH